MTITEEQRALAIEMLKDGRPPEAVHARIVELGGTNDEVYAFVSELVRLKSEAAARDPARLREEAKWILIRGGTVEDVIAAFGAVGVAAEHARPEAERMLAIVRTMRPCTRCGAPMLPNEVMFDIAGNTICPSCYTRAEILVSEQRGAAAEMDGYAGSGSGLMLMAVVKLIEGPPAYATPPLPTLPTRNPGAVCPSCHSPALVSTSTLPPHHPVASSGARMVCLNCGVGQP